MESSDGASYIGRIPIRNLWLLMLYASQLLREIGPAGRAVEEIPDEIPNLVAELLARRVEEKLRQGFSRSYLEEAAVLGRVRGCIDFLETERHQLFWRGKIACRYQTLDVNTVLNRFAKAALHKSAALVYETDRDLAMRCRALAGIMSKSGVVGERPSRAELSAYQPTRFHRGDRAILAVARLVFELALPTEFEGDTALSELDRGNYVRQLFEAAVGGFFDVILVPKGWKVATSKSLSWQVTTQTHGMSRILPGMVTDIVLEDPSHRTRTVIDTKFASILTQGQFGHDSLKSNYIYQIYAYLRSQEGQDEMSASASGLMLHPAIDISLDESVVIQGHRIRFATVDLAGTPVEIRAQLLNVVEFSDAAR